MNPGTDDGDAPVALITGASRGFGFAVALALGAVGWQVIALARTTGGLEDLADAIGAAGGPVPTLVPLSLTDEGGLRRLGLAIHERWDHLDLVVHAAAHAAPLSPAPHIGDKDFAQSTDVNYKGTRLVLTMFAPLLGAAEDGRFVHVHDRQAGKPFFGAYGSSKTAADTLVRSWRAEAIRTGPQVLRFEPHPMPTALRYRFYPGEDKSKLTDCRAEAARLLATLDIAAS